MSLVRIADFRRLWAGQSISVLGDQITLLALPLAAVLTLDASAGQMGLLTAAGWAPHLLFSLPVGVWIDRQEQRRRILIAADLARAAVLATIPLAAVFDAVTIGHLYAVAFLIGSLSVFFDLSYGSFLVSVVPREQFVDAQSKLSTSRSVSYIAGPSAAGALVQVLTAPFALAADAASFLVSAFFLSRIEAKDIPLEPHDGSSVRRRLGDGFRFILGHALLRPSFAAVSVLNFFTMMTSAIAVLYFSESLGLAAGLIGIVFGAGALGGLVGALVATRVASRIGTGPTITLGCFLFPAALALFPLATGPRPVVVAMLLAGEFFASLGVMLFDVNNNSLNLLVTPHRLRGRVGGAGRVLAYGGRPLGALAGGALGSLIGLRPTLFASVAGALLAGVILLVSPLARLQEPPPEEG